VPCKLRDAVVETLRLGEVKNRVERQSVVIAAEIARGVHLVGQVALPERELGPELLPPALHGLHLLHWRLVLHVDVNRVAVRLHLRAEDHHLVDGDAQLLVNSIGLGKDRLAVLSDALPEHPAKMEEVPRVPEVLDILAIGQGHALDRRPVVRVNENVLFVGLVAHPPEPYALSIALQPVAPHLHRVNK
jgi:hypothetical protein